MQMVVVLDEPRLRSPSLRDEGELGKEIGEEEHSTRKEGYERERTLTRRPGTRVKRRSTKALDSERYMLH